MRRYLRILNVAPDGSTDVEDLGLGKTGVFVGPEALRDRVDFGRLLAGLRVLVEEFRGISLDASFSEETRWLARSSANLGGALGEELSRREPTREAFTPDEVRASEVIDACVDAVARTHGDLLTPASRLQSLVAALRWACAKDAERAGLAS